MLLALLSGVLINLGFVLQQRGHSHALARGRWSLIEGFRDRSWLIGQAVGWLGFAGAIIAVGIASLLMHHTKVSVYEAQRLNRETAEAERLEAAAIGQ